jgi:SagB-type dehydrogenase family enzyme
MPAGESSLSGEALLGSVTVTSFRTLSPGIEGVGLRTHALRFENVSDGRLPRPSEEFLVASRNRRWDRETTLSVAGGVLDAELVSRARTDREPRSLAPVLALPPSAPLTMGLTEVVAARRSVRAFSGDAVPFPSLAAILRHSASVTAIGEVDLDSGSTVEVGLRASPSGGALYPVQTWVAALRVAGLQRRIYRFRPHDDGLSALTDPDRELVDRLCATLDLQDGSIDLTKVGALVLWVARPWRAMRKYGPRGMRLVFQEAGAMALNAALAATASGLGFVDFSGYYDDEAHAVLGIDGVYEALIHAAIVGVPR